MKTKPNRKQDDLAASSSKSKASNKKTTLPKASAKVHGALDRAAEELWSVDVTPHLLLRALHDILLLRCLKEADGNYAGAAALFGPSRQSVQQYANSSLRDDRWKPYRRNRRRQGAS